MVAHGTTVARIREEVQTLPVVTRVSGPHVAGMTTFTTIAIVVFKVRLWDAMAVTAHGAAVTLVSTTSAIVVVGQQVGQGTLMLAIATVARLVTVQWRAIVVTVTTALAFEALV